MTSKGEDLQWLYAGVLFISTFITLSLLPVVYLLKNRE